MAKQGKIAKNAKTGRVVVGRKSFAKISAVEGIVLTKAMEKRASEAIQKALRLKSIAAQSCAATARVSERYV